jgi:hypothetical protein
MVTGDSDTVRVVLLWTFKVIAGGMILASFRDCRVSQAVQVAGQREWYGMWCECR